MASRLLVKPTRSAAAQIRHAATWWRENRDKSPLAFSEDLERAFEVIALQPGVGARATHFEGEDIRRLLLSRTGYHLYYRVNAVENRVEVLALWHMRRGIPPEL